jgi:SagB-type dehydrogenase family enzyme
MNRIELLDPIPRKKVLDIAKFSYAIKAKDYLPIPERPRDREFFSTIESRRSRRDFRRVSKESLTALLWYCCKVHETFRLPSGLPAQHRCPPSGGGIHPIDILLLNPRRPSALLYDPIAHALCELGNTRNAQVGVLLKKIEKIVAMQDGQVFWFAAEFGRTMSRYKNAESIVWRDAGVLLSMFCFVGEALGLNCCAIGATGEPFISRFLNSSGLVTGVGGCLVGAKP